MNRFEPPPLPGGDHRAQEPANPYATPTDPPRPSPSPSSGSGYGSAPQAPWGAPASATHPQGTIVLVLGILSVVVAPLFGPFAWVMGRRALREVDAAPYPTSNRSSLQAGTILGIVGTAFLVLAALFVVGFVGLVIAGMRAS